MKFIKLILLSILKSVILFLLSTVAFMSFIQQKFPPTFTDPRESLAKLRTLMAAVSNFNPASGFDGKFNPEQLIASRQKLMDEINKLDPSTMVGVKNEQGKPIVEKDWNALRTRLDQSEYKIRLLEYEVSVLKNEFKKLKPETK